MRSVTIQKPVVDLKATGAQIKSLRIKYGFSVHDIQTIFGFEYPQAVYAWDRERRLQAGKMLKWSILSESPSSCAAKACGAWGGERLAKCETEVTQSAAPRKKRKD